MKASVRLFQNRGMTGGIRYNVDLRTPTYLAWTFLRTHVYQNYFQNFYFSLAFIYLSYLKYCFTLSYFLNCRWFTSIVLLVRALEVILPSSSWHPAVPHTSRRSPLSRSSRSLWSQRRRSLLSCCRRSLLSRSTRRMSSTARATTMTHLTTPH
jgi:hypothetical protein